VNEVSVSQQLARRDRHFLHPGNHPERANAAQAPDPLGANLRFDPCFLSTENLHSTALSMDIQELGEDQGFSWSLDVFPLA
jgi:hypothetical protein